VSHWFANIGFQQGLFASAVYLAGQVLVLSRIILVVASHLRASGQYAHDSCSWSITASNPKWHKRMAEKNFRSAYPQVPGSKIKMEYQNIFFSSNYKTHLQLRTKFNLQKTSTTYGSKVVAVSTVSRSIYWNVKCPIRDA